MHAASSCKRASSTRPSRPPRRPRHLAAARPPAAWLQVDSAGRHCGHDGGRGRGYDAGHSGVAGVWGREDAVGGRGREAEVVSDAGDVVDVGVELR